MALPPSADPRGPQDTAPPEADRTEATASPDDPSGRYLANLNLIRKRIADDPRQPGRPRRWWQFGS